MARELFTLRAAAALFFRHRSPWILLFILGALITGRIFLPAAVTRSELLIALSASVYWPLQEWWMHRWLLHLPAFSLFGRTIEPSFARLHRLHHADPADIPLSFLPISTIFGALFAFSGLVYSVSTSIPVTLSFMSAATTSTLLYEWVHFLTHTDYRPRGRYYRAIWKLHRWHHYKNEGYWFSFTVPIIDRLLGTGPAPGDVPKSPTVRSLNARFGEGEGEG